MEPVIERLASRKAALRWLVRLRWHAAAGAAIAVGVGRASFELDLPLAPLIAVIAAIVASNLALARHDEAPGAQLGWIIAADTVLLTLLLGFAGGAENPFAILYLLLITLASHLAGRVWSGAVFGLAAAGFAALFVWHRPLPALADLQPYSVAVALVIGAGAHAFTIGRLTTALREHHLALAAVRGRVGRIETLAAVGTLAAGAAHELGTPLGAIAIAASDLEHMLPPGEAVEEARAIRDDVDRCRRIIDRMVARSGVTLGEVPAPTTAAAVLAQLGAELGAELEARIERDAVFRCPVTGLVQVLANLVRNAHQAGGAATLTAVVDAERVVFVVEDDGRGVAADLVARIGEPFVTTRPGEGMGLGLYLGRTFAELWGGSLTVAAGSPRGTRVRLELPRQPVSHG
jgi:two-component system sensor histidine kinase RegB